MEGATANLVVATKAQETAQAALANMQVSFQRQKASAATKENELAAQLERVHSAPPPPPPPVAALDLHFEQGVPLDLTTSLGKRVVQALSGLQVPIDQPFQTPQLQEVLEKMAGGHA